MIKELVKFEFKNSRLDFADIVIYLSGVLISTVIISNFTNIPCFFFFIMCFPLLPDFGFKEKLEFILSKPVKRIHIFYAKTIKTIITTFLILIFSSASLILCNSENSPYSQLEVSGFENVRNLSRSNNLVLIENQEQKNETEMLNGMPGKNDSKEFQAKISGYKRSFEIKYFLLKSLFFIAIFFLTLSFLSEVLFNRKKVLSLYAIFASFLVASFLLPLFLLPIGFVMNPVLFYMDNFSFAALVLGVICIGMWLIMKRAFQTIEIR